MNQPGKIFKLDTSKPYGSTVASFEIYKFVDENDPILKAPTLPFDFQNPPIDPAYLATSLFETMFKAKGLGLTASQVGLPYSVFVCGYDNSNKQVFFNPKIVEESEEKVLDIEGCLSFRNMFVNIERPKEIVVAYQHVNGEYRTAKFEGLTARVVCHEIDHINGITFNKRCGKLSWMLAKEKREKLNKKLARSR